MEMLIDELKLLVRARYPVVYLVSSEEERVDRMLEEAAIRLKKTLYSWTGTEGFWRVDAKRKDLPAIHAGSSPVDLGAHPSGDDSLRIPLSALDHIVDSKEHALFALKDFHPFLELPGIVRRLRDVISHIRHSYKTLLLVSPVLKLPPELEKDVTVVDVPLPYSRELMELLRKFVRHAKSDSRFRVTLSQEMAERIVKAAQGLTEAQAWRVFSKVLVADQHFDDTDLPKILEEKKQIIRKLGILEYYEGAASLDDIGGLDGLKRWLGNRRDAFTDRAREYGLPEPKGVLLLGVQGCGKSLACKAIAATWNLPLLRLDVGRIFSSYIGASEENMRKAIRIAESLAPVVLWIDEIEKGFSGAKGSGAADAGATMRVFATFLTWLQEKTQPVFVAATANQIQDLPPELLRKGRLDEIFFVDLPSREERKAIFDIHLRKRKRKPEGFDIERLVASSEGYSGAEIEQAIVASMYDAFAAAREFATEDVERALRESVPLSTTMAEDIESLREWARTRARPASV